MPLSTLHLPFLGLGSEDALHGMADALPDGLFTTDLEGRVTFWNRAAERITGWTREEALGRDCSILAGDAVHGCACGAGPLKCGLAESGRTSKCCTAVRKDGRPLLIVKNAVPLLSPAGKPVGALESFTDVTAAAVADRRRPSGMAIVTGDFEGLVGRAPAMQELYRLMTLVAGSESTVMILGESGTGKERIAEAVHRLSRRGAGPFVRVSCSALNENLLESELFGHVKGAFTGAVKDRRGRFQEAHGGTLLLDEIGDISPLVQVKLLRVIEQREIERVGDSAPVKVDVRLLCATHRNLKALVEAGRFRADLFFRLNVFPIRVPPLRERIEDLELLAGRFLERLVAPGAPPPRIGAEAVAALSAYGWPGNVRELQNVLEYAALQAGAGSIGLEHLPAEVRAAPPAARTGPAGRAAEEPGADRDTVMGALEACQWNRSRAAARLGISRVTLWKRMKALGLVEP